MLRAASVVMHQDYLLISLLRKACSAPEDAFPSPMLASLLLIRLTVTGK